MVLPSPRRYGRSLAIVLILLAAGFTTQLMTAPRVAAATTHYLSGSACTGNTTPVWVTGDTWILHGDVFVGSGCALTIQRGVTVRADSNVHLYVNGSLWSNGSPAQPVQFEANQTSVLPWAGIQFNQASRGSVSWSNFTRVQIAVSAQSSSPAISNNTILLASAGVRLDRSSSLVTDNVIDGRRIGSFGIILTSSDVSLERNRINGTTFGIRASGGGNVTAAQNTLTNTSGATAIAIYIDNVASATLMGNTIRTVFGTAGATGAGGGTAIGVLLNGTTAAVVNGNTIEDVRGGRGGDGSNSAVGPGSAGGVGGAAAAVALGYMVTAILQGNTVNNIVGNRGGNGGSSSLGRGGPGGAGGIAFALELFSASGNATFLSNSVTNVTGGSGGTGGRGTATTSNGAGGAGADAYGIFLPGGMNASVSGNAVRRLRGGIGGDTPLNNTLPGNAGAGGSVTGVILIANGVATIHANTVDNLTGGIGGSSIVLGGAGGNATGMLALGSSPLFNRTVASYNRVSNVTGGTGGVGGKRSGDGGNGTGIGGLEVDLFLSSNTVSSVRGGNGGAYAVISNPASGGGSAAGVVFLQVPNGVSSLDTVQGVSPGVAGGGVSPPTSYGVGYFFIGNSTDRTHVSITNGTISGVSDFDLYVDNYTRVTTLNTPFSGSKVAVMAAGNLTVLNYLAVRILWPNGITTVWGARIVVTDNGIESYNQTSPFGYTPWIVVTNRMYIDSPIPIWNGTRVSVTYQTYAFSNNPRDVNMTESRTEAFTMIDSTAPTSNAFGLLPWTTSRTFAVSFFASDGFGVGLAQITLWYRLNGTVWVADGTTTSTFLGFGQFSFIAPSDGKYEFATTAVDQAGNSQQPTPPTANNTWTIVDTVAPTSHVLALPPYETSSTFTVTWAADGGVTDVANYTIQVDRGSGWADWLTNTTATSASYTAVAQGPIAFRAVARDYAGNQESKTGNDTWIVVDTIAPQVVSESPTGNLTTSPTTITIVFTEPMDTASVQAALQIRPSINNETVSWSTDSRTLTVQVSSALPLGTTYTITIGTGAKDLAGNALVLASVFTFSLPAPPPAPGLTLLDLWPLFVVIAAIIGALALLLARRRSAGVAETVAEAPKPAPPPALAKSEAAIDDVFLLYRKDGVLIKHETRRLRPDIDSDILSGMLNAVQQFVKDSFRGEEGEELNEMTVGQMHILIGRGKWLILAATITGGDVDSMSSQIQLCVADMEDHNWDRLEDWDGDMDLAKVLGPYLKKLIRGEYVVTRAAS